MRIRWFGETWHAHLCDQRYWIETPTGARCLSCKEIVEDDDRGVAMAFSGIDEPQSTIWVDAVPDSQLEDDEMPGYGGGGQAVVYHLDCHLETLIPRDATEIWSRFPERKP